MDRGLTDYKAALDALFARTGSTAKFGLERTSRFLELIGKPQSRFDSFHVAGTNGKGSVVATLYALLEAKGLRVGRYMSPHLIDFRERIVVAGEAVTEQYVVEFLDRWSADAIELGATFFEITTAMAFHYFAQCEVDVAVIETGLGGRLDSTNVIDPLVAGITSIGLDHQEYLGDSEESIAREKAGILKRGRAAVLGPLSVETHDAVCQVAERAGVSRIVDARDMFATSDIIVTRVGTAFTLSHGGESRRVTTGLIGRAQAANASVALAMLDVAGPRWAASLDDAQRILPTVKLAGRFQIVGNIILDVAHNPDGMHSVVATLESIIPDGVPVAVLGVLADKDWRGIIIELSEIVERLVLVAPPSAPFSRAWSTTEARDFALSRGIETEVQPDFTRAIRDAAASPVPVLITGSFHTVGDALAILGEKTF